MRSHPFISAIEKSSRAVALALLIPAAAFSADEHRVIEIHCGHLFDLIMPPQ